MCMSTETGGRESQSNPETLDWKSQEILRAIYKNDGSANTTEIRTLTGIDNNDKILYRFREKLVPRELIELEQPKSETGRPEPKVATFTQTGVKAAERIIDERAAPADVESRVDKLEADISRVTDRIERVSARSSDRDDETATESEHEELQAKTDQLLYQMGLIADFLNEQFDGGLSDYRERRERNDNVVSADD